jgi:hypothetical protein
MCKSFFDFKEDTKKRYDDYQVYQMLCDHLWYHQSKRKAVFGIGDFYEHAKELLTKPENLYRVEQIKNTCLYTRFI